MKKTTHISALTFLAVICLSACATVETTYAPDGREAHAINCSGAALGWDQCYKAAGDICGTSGYEILDKTSEGSAAAGGSGSTFGTNVNTDRTMLIACKKKK
jgi:hypothetical protein